MDARSAQRLIRATGLAVLVLALAACSGGNSGEPTVQTSTDGAPVNAPLVPSEAPPSTSTSVKRGSVPIVPRKPASTMKPATGSPPPAPISANACSAGRLKIRVVRQTAITALLTLTNTGKATCSLSGWPTIALTLAGTTTALPTINVDEPNAPVGIALRPARTAFAGLRWKSCAATAPKCRVGDRLQVGAPGAAPTAVTLTGFPGNRLAASVLEIGAIQPTTTNIVNW